jgi:hypothetical protein
MVVKQDKLDEPKRTRDKVATRGKIKGISRKSRKNLLRLLNKIEPNGNYYFVTLTYGKNYSLDFKEWKKHLHRLFSSLKYHYPKLSSIWRLEFQKRGAPHYHLLLSVPDKPSQSKLRLLIRKIWLRAIQDNSYATHRHAVRVDVVRDLKKCGFYLSLYQSKDANDRQDIATGREWGIYGKPNLQFGAYGSECISRNEQRILRRIVRKWLQAYNRRHRYATYLGYPSGSFDVFIPIHESKRLLRWVKQFVCAELETSRQVDLAA